MVELPISYRTGDDLDGMAVTIANRLALIIVNAPHRVSDRAANLILERAGVRFCCALRECEVPENEIMEALDVLADAFTYRLEELESALRGEPGHG